MIDEATLRAAMAAREAAEVRHADATRASRAATDHEDRLLRLMGWEQGAVGESRGRWWSPGAPYCEGGEGVTRDAALARTLDALRLVGAFKDQGASCRNCGLPGVKYCLTCQREQDS